MEQVTIIGTGWLGEPLAAGLVGSYDVTAGYRREELRQRLLGMGVNAVRIDLPGTLPDLRSTRKLILTLPPGGRQYGAETTERYLDMLRPLAPWLPGMHVVYTSSTGVYGSRRGGRVTEETPVDPDTDSGRAVVAAEEWLGRTAGGCAILRMGGLYGPGRDPVRFFARAEAIPQADAPVNMLSLGAAIAAVRTLLDSGKTGIFNACSARHPSKRTFYGELYRAAGLDPKPFLPGGEGGKRIDSSKLRRLGWQNP